MSRVLVLSACAIVISFGLTWLIRIYAINRRLLDVPNDRSSHSVATPRGGGLAIVVTFLLGLVLLYSWGLVPTDNFLALSVCGSIVALTGFVDDHRDIRPAVRLLVHFLVAAMAIYWSGGLPEIRVGSWTLASGLVVDAVAALGLVWLLNLYNFMDGIDGIASAEGISTCIGAAVIQYAVAGGGSTWIIAVVLAGSIAGFLMWNLPPARIFMGDVGSGFLGFSLGVLMIQSAWSDAQLIWVWIILLGVFIVDATLTLLDRLFRGERIFAAHRTHAYQLAAVRFRSHRIVTVAVVLINVFWLSPWAFAVGVGKIDGALGTTLAYVPLVGLVLAFRSGKPSPQ